MSIPISIFLLSIVLATVLGAAAGLFWAARHGGTGFLDSAGPDEANPWELQRALMEASGQPIAKQPAITNTSVLYGALLMEELGETMAGLSDALEGLRRWEPRQDIRELALILQKHLSSVAAYLDGEAVLIRDLLKGKEFHMALTDAEALPLFDGTTDITVVNAGFCLASGFDGNAGYAEVALSNLSKANPATGMIDKTPDGKWIKGSRYKEPNLARVLARTRAQSLESHR